MLSLYECTIIIAVRSYPESYIAVSAVWLKNQERILYAFEHAVHGLVKPEIFKYFFKDVRIEGVFSV